MATRNKIPVAVIGATGYTGVELIRLACKHPRLQLVGITSEKSSGLPFSKVFPAFYKQVDLTLEPFDADQIASRAELAFLCLPHGESAKAAHALLQHSIKLIDLSADFRIHSLEIHEQWYGKHPFPELHQKAVYGLCELYRDRIRKADLVANPGCYPTSAALALAPLVRKQLIELNSIIVDSKSGVSGGGRSASLDFHFSEVSEGFKAYKVGSHRHTPEIEQTLSELAGQNLSITFAPHLVPMNRGILTTAYARPLHATSTAELVAIFEEFYQDEPFIRVKAPGEFPNTRDVRGTNFCDLSVLYDARAHRIIVLSVIDNLTKGASGQALQNFNLLMGLEETLGLEALSIIP